MKNILTFLVLFSFVIGVKAQNQNPVYKTLNDSIFEKSDIVKLPVIYFSLSGKQQIIHEHIDSMLQVKNFLIKFPNLKVQVTVHTDQRGTKEGNAKLSVSRAKGFVNYLTQEGISSDRLTYFGYGESKPIISQEEIDTESDLPLKEKLYAMNRRTELIIE